ncbi:MAG: OmpA family protein [Lachnospiraceae bacterium]|nr:OmpA family protein [Lachnospiraceae bacterium]
MRKERKSREAFAEHSYWQSYSDMMAALLLIFVLIIAMTLAIYKKKTTDLENTRMQLASATSELETTMQALENSRAEIEAKSESLANSLLELQEMYEQAALTDEELNEAYLKIAQTQSDLNSAYLEIAQMQSELATTRSELQSIIGIRTDLIGELQNQFNNSTMAVDAQTGSITFSSDVLFSVDSSTLTASSKKELSEVIPKYLSVLLQDSYRENISEIIIEGHTDTNGSYAYNMELSYERAKAVADFCLGPANGLTEDQIARLQELLTVNGKSYSDPVYVTDSEGNNTAEIDMDASRRVEIKFRLKEEEMMKRIGDVLNGN